MERIRLSKCVFTVLTNLRLALWESMSDMKASLQNADMTVNNSVRCVYMMATPDPWPPGCQLDDCREEHTACETCKDKSHNTGNKPLQDEEHTSAC
jgi:hypothetical protein